ncbi:YcxB family protein [Flavobacterium circumlabens]|uniref:YcxB family protein n=1 Tax=Flavobacterium circumlabens TaxID=2133765 RepID=A0A4Y7UJI3_9FLAO|nr:YcxB family protein [Flavobacterium circumlabens]TCN60836.1 YcxB-like protein [Flavobacterium circumlabens]TEB45969.1 YcxB family protein [Flavobacterium circumlabens]
MIKTKKFHLTKKEYFFFIIRILLKKRWWLYSFILFLSVAFLFKDQKDSTDIFMIAFGFLFLLVTVFQYWRFANSKENEIFFKETQYEIFKDKIISNMGEVSEGTIAIGSFIKVLELKGLYLLYISKGQCFYFPKRVFETQEDENWFRKEVFLKIKNK